MVEQERSTEEKPAEEQPATEEVVPIEPPTPEELAERARKVQMWNDS